MLPAESPPQLSATRRNLVLGAMCLALVMVISGISMLNNALPKMAEALNLGQSDQQWVIDGYTVVLAALLLVAGAIGDRFGRRGAMIGGTVVYGVATLLSSIVTSSGALIGTRFLAGVGAAFVMPGTLSTITSVFPPEGRAKAVGIWAGFAGVGGTLGQFMSGVLVDHFYWGSVFLASTTLAVVTVIAVVLFVPSTKAAEKVALDPVGAVLSAAAVGLVVLGIIEGPGHGWTSALTLGSIFGGVALAAGFVAWELRIEEPMLDPRLFRSRGLATGSVAMFFQFLAMFGFFFVGTQYMQLVLGFSALKTAVAFFPMSLVFLVISPSAATLAEKRGHRQVAGTGLVVAAGGFAVMATVQANSGYWLILVASLVMALGMSYAMTPATNAIVSSLPIEKQGVASAINDVTRELGAAFGVAIIGSSFNTGYRNSIDKHLAGLSAGDASLAHEAPATALAVANKLGGAGGRLAADAKGAFVDGLRSAVIVSAISLAIAAAYTLWRAPSRQPALGEDRVDFSESRDDDLVALAAD
ncbi:MAG: qacA 3 [Acidimicrobiia bacterium]|nr:qacA 3 [Acidimicrobiia bacterium]